MKEKGKNKKLIIIGMAILVTIIIVGIMMSQKSRNSSAKNVSNTILSKTKLVNSISESGNIKSKNTQKIYSTLNYPIKEIKVSVGDQVLAGDSLAKLDTSALELDIAQQRNSLNNAQKTSTIDLENKKSVLSNMKNQYENGLNSELINAENSIQTAKVDIDTKKTTYESNKVLFESDAISKQEFNQSETNYNNALTAYNKAQASLKSIKAKIEQDIKTAEANLSTAEVNSNNDSQKIAIQKLEKGLSDSVIKAPIDGTVTAVYAVVGSSGNGLLFVIEDTKNLIITTYVKEYDSGQVHPGQTVNIKSDAIGDKVIKGEVIKISPTSTKNAVGETNTSSSVEFETEVAISDYNPELKIGMNARLDIILEEKDGVYSVPYDAITTNVEGQNVVYIITEEQGKQIVKELPVEIGMETDFYTEVSGTGLSEGVIVVNNATEVKTGDVVDLQAPKGGVKIGK